MFKNRTYSNFLIAVGSLGYALVQRGVNELDETAEVFWRLEEKKYYLKILIIFELSNNQTT